MKVARRPVLSAEDQAMLEEVRVRLICPAERAVFDQLLIQEHYLKKAELVGEQLWVRELRPGARTMLRGRNLPAALKAPEAGPVPACPQSAQALGQMLRFFQGMKDGRCRRGDYSVASLVTGCVGAALGCQGGTRTAAGSVTPPPS